ncbi:MAG: hypothetical protein ABIJ34_03980 [archaeon]
MIGRYTTGLIVIKKNLYLKKVIKKLDLCRFQKSTFLDADAPRLGSFGVAHRSFSIENGRLPSRRKNAQLK